MKLAEMSEQEILCFVNPIMDNLMLGSTEIDYEKHVRDFTKHLKALISEAGLKRMCSEYQAHWGVFQKREFVALFRRHDSIAVIWRQFCSKTNDEYVASAVFVETNGRVLVDHALIY